MKAYLHRIRTKGFTVAETIALGSFGAFAAIIFMAVSSLIIDYNLTHP